MKVCLESGMPRRFSGVWIPAWLWLNKNLSLSEKCLLVEIESLSGNPRGCYASNSHFAEHMGLSISRVSTVLNEMEKKQLITIEYKREGKRIVERQIRLCTPFENGIPPFGNAMNPFRKCEEPPFGNAKGSNTTNNNTINNKTPLTPKGGTVARFDPLSVDLPSCLPASLWADWVEYRKAIKKPLKAASVAAQLRQLEKWFMAGHNLESIISTSIANGWTGLFEPKVPLPARRDFTQCAPVDYEIPDGWRGV